MMKPASANSSLRRRAAVPPHSELKLPLQAVSLSNGQYTVHLHGVGTGYSEWGGAAVSRWTADEHCGAEGFHIYLQDLDSDFVWSAGYMPTRVAPQRYDFSCERDVAEIVRTDGNIECRLTVCISPHFDLEVRRCQLINRGRERRRLQMTSYLEWVLGGREADASHPTFSKLFVETSYCAEHRAVLARRRPRHGDEPEMWGFHSMISDRGSDPRACVEFETNRAQFIGRGRTLARPRALEPEMVLSGEWGPVLDPIASLRVALELEPGETRVITYLAGAGCDRSDIDRSIGSICDFADVEYILNKIRSPDLIESLSQDGDAERVTIHSPHDMELRDCVELAKEPFYLPTGIEVIDDHLYTTSVHHPLEFENGYGGFAADGREYVIRVSSDGRGGLRLPPLPWVNVIANERVGFLVTERGAGYTWSGNSRLNRLTAWHNDPVSDPHSEAIWLRDEDARVYWSPLPGPTASAGDYLVRHGFGYTTFEHNSHGLVQEATMFVARDEPAKLTRVRLENVSGRTRRLSLFSYLHWALGGLAAESTGQVRTAVDTDNQVIWATNAKREHYGSCVAFSTPRVNDSSARCSISYTCDRDSFLGRFSDLLSPDAIARGVELDCRAGSGLDPCAAWQLSIELPPDTEFECTFLLGEAVNREAALNLTEKFGNKARVQGALEQVREFWRETVSAITIETPDREIDLMVNGWLTYQNLSCRIWGRSAYYQPGGAFGFRDQLQDASALVYHRPEMTRAQILRHGAQQFVEGDVLHWWHPDTGYGLRTRFSDDLLWLPYIVAEYVQKTGDKSIWDEELAFLVGSELAEGKHEVYLRPTFTGGQATLYEHCCRALDRGLTAGQHGLPLIGCGDWNDGFSRIGWLGRGESVWLGFFIDHILERMLPNCAQRGDDERLARYSAYRERLRSSLNSAGWDGAWYRRAFYDDGEPLGSASCDECQIDAIAQSWAVISGVASPERAKMAMDAVEERLIDDHAGIIRLLTPAFDSTKKDPGYIKGYLPGIRENGGQYTHGVLWVVWAMAEMGRGTRAVELLRKLSPIWHSNTEQRAEVYRTEPYVVAADIYGESPHVGRGGWTWYTGSAGWMLRVAVESIFGFTTENGHTLLIKPSISSAWPRCRMSYRVPNSETRYDITIENPCGNELGVKEAFLDGESAVVANSTARIPLLRDGKQHHVIVRL